MFKMFKIIVVTYLSAVNAQLTVQGSQRDEHNCVLDGGYEWCESNNACQRPWETPCEDVVEYCQASNVQTCRMACDDPVCPTANCAMRVGNCCDYTCIEQSIDISTPECPKTCPPPEPCPMPMISSNCQIVPAIIDNCGCENGCDTIDCSTSPKISEGGTCGGFMPYGMAGICDDGLECVYTMGPMVADAPGICKPHCSTSRDQWGNCIEEGCKTWFDGCNTCEIEKDGSQTCTELVCYDLNSRGEPECRDNLLGDGGPVSNPVAPQIPNNCVTWYDGCNTCSVTNGVIGGCTMMYCFVQNDPYCQAFTSGILNIGELCYRFCEDNSQNPIDRQSYCPDGTECSPERNQVSMVVFDSCGERAHTCNLITGH